MRRGERMREKERELPGVSQPGSSGTAKDIKKEEAKSPEAKYR